MPRSFNQSARWAFTVLFLLMIVLATSAGIFGNSLAQQLLIIFIPFSAVVIGIVNVGEAHSSIGIGLALVLTLSGCVATLLGVLGAGSFSNLFVNVALIGSLLGYDIYNWISSL